MEVGLIFKLAGLGILVAVAHTVLKISGKEDFGFWVTLGGICIALIMVVQMLGDLFEEVKSVFSLF